MKHMDGTVMAGVNYSSWPRKLLPGEDKQVLTDRAVEGVREAIKAAEDCGVLFCVEVVKHELAFNMQLGLSLEGQSDRLVIAGSLRLASADCSRSQRRIEI
jgi:hypothetical protein